MRAISDDALRAAMEIWFGDDYEDGRLLGCANDVQEQTEHQMRLVIAAVRATDRASQAALIAKAREQALEEAAKHLQTLAEAMYEKADHIADVTASMPFDLATPEEQDANVMAYDFEQAANAICALIPAEAAKGGRG